MKFFAVVVCVFLVQLSSGHVIRKRDDSTVESVRDHVNQILGVSTQFVDDVVDVVLREFPRNAFVIESLDGFMEVLARELDGKTSKIDMCRMKKFVEFFEKDSKEAFKYIENLIVLESVLSSSQSPDSTNRVKNLIRAFRVGASSKEEHEALEYLYGPEPVQESEKNGEMTIPTNCQLNPSASADLSSVIDINPQVVKDIENISKKFPCNEFVSMFIDFFVRAVTSELNGRTKKIDFHAMSRYASSLQDQEHHLRKEINILETILSTRMSKEETQGALNVARALHPNSSVKDIEEALEYLYGA